jgi:hypothetical protein
MSALYRAVKYANNKQTSDIMVCKHEALSFYKARTRQVSLLNCQAYCLSDAASSGPSQVRTGVLCWRLGRWLRHDYGAHPHHPTSSRSSALCTAYLLSWQHVAWFQASAEMQIRSALVWGFYAEYFSSLLPTVLGGGGTVGSTFKSHLWLVGRSIWDR